MFARCHPRPWAVALIAILAGLIAPAAACADVGHVVAIGETLSSIAAQDGLSVPALAAANGMSPDAQLIAGSVLEIPPQAAPSAGSDAVTGRSGTATEGSGTATEGSGTATEGSETPGGGPQAQAGASPDGDGTYVVQPGDTLSAIAERAGTTVAELAAANGLDPSGVLDAGVRLELPSVELPSAVDLPGAEPEPSDTFVSASQIGAIAVAADVPPAFAQAIAWQESGFNDAEVSPEGAVGVMQILPATWSWIRQSLSGGNLLSPTSAAGNVTAGVLLLRYLLNATGSEARAADAYYQGLRSVELGVIYPATQAYTAAVLALTERFSATMGGSPL
jgi:LysM repeat protein